MTPLQRTAVRGQHVGKTWDHSADDVGADDSERAVKGALRIRSFQARLDPSDRGREDLSSREG
jgi:hypothetical protein